MSHLAEILATRKTPLQQGLMEMTVPLGPCHPVVGGTYDEQYEKQLAKVTNLIAGSQPLPVLPRVGMPSVEEWDALRSRPPKVAKPNTAPQSPQRKGTSDWEDFLARILLTDNYESATEFITNLWSNDATNIHRLAATSKALREAVDGHLSRFHLPSRDFNLCDFTKYSLVTMAGSTNGSRLHKHLLVVGKDLRAPSAPITGIPKLWESDTNRSAMLAKAESENGTFQMTVKLAPYYAVRLQLLDMERRLSDKQQSLGQVAGRAPTHHHLREATYAIPLLRSLHEYGAKLTCLRLHEVPGLDLRVTKLILSACVSLHKLDIIECELLHFSTILPLLDIIHFDSKDAGKDPVRLRFRPKTWLGTDNDCQGTMVLSFNGIQYRNIPAAVMTTVFMAVVKAVPMGIDLVSEDREFRRYLEMIPMRPGAMGLFLHNLMMYVDVIQDPVTWASLDRKTRDDLENQVLLSIAGSKLSSSKRNVYFQTTWECDSCRHHLITAFFRPAMGTRPADQRTCRTCELYVQLNTQDHHRLLEKRELIRDLLYNMDEDMVKQNHIATMSVPANELQKVLAPTLPTPFERSPAATSNQRKLAFLWHYKLPMVADLVSENREYDILRTSGRAAVLDVVDEIAALDGIYPDHPTLTRQQRASGTRMKQSWEYYVWRELGKEETPDEMPAGYW